MISEDEQLLRRYVEDGSELAFGELVKRHVDLVYSAALRMLNGDSHAAQDVTQTVFADLARKARALPRGVLLAGWLYRHACFTAANVARGEQRRKTRERIAMEISMASGESIWKGIAPVLEESMARLSKKEREAIVLRFFKQMDFRAVAAALEVGEDAAQKRVARGLEKLRVQLKRRGVVVSTAALAAVLTTEAVSAAPLSVVASVAGTALASATGGGVSITLLKLMAMTKLKVATGAVVAGLMATAVWQYQSNAKLRDENRALAEQVAQVEQLKVENARLAAQPKAEPVSNQDQMKELLRLRSEVGRLRKEMAEAAKAQQKKTQAARQDQPQNNSEEEAQQEKMAKLSHGKNWMLSFIMFANDNKGQFPTNFQQAMSYVENEKAGEMAATTNQFEIVYKGSIDNITKPSETIVVREQQAWQAPDGGWFKIYAFADGHAEVRKAVDGNFDAYENEHIQRAEQNQVAQ